VAGSAAALSAALPSETPPARPNIVFILADDLGYGDLGCYGQRSFRTPAIDRIAAEGMRFTDFHCGSPVCAPSRCALMTGLHNGHSRIRGNGTVPLHPEDVTIAEVLKNAGYSTGVFGKWGMGEAGSTGVPNRKGFDEWFGFLNQGRAHNYYPDWVWQNEEQFFVPKGAYIHDLFTQRALDFVGKQRSQPFFLYLAYTIPHANSELVDAGMQVPSDAPYTDRHWPQQLKNYAAMITRMDADIGKLMALLKERDLDRNTIVMFSSDNGPHAEGGADPPFFDSNGPLRGIKRDLYEGGIRVPLAARWPGHIKPGSTNTDPLAFWDLFPTFAEIGGAASPAGLDGISLVPALTGHRQPQHEFMYWEFHERGFEQAVRMGKWKAVRHATHYPIELYDLSTDAGERIGLAARYPEITARIAEYLRTARTPSAEFPIKEPQRTVVQPPR
jgi:arylsulfatase A-like enzyme